MAVNDSYRRWVLDQLTEVVPVREKRMFGCVGVYSQELFFGIIAEAAVYFKVNRANRTDYETRGMEAFTPYQDKSRKTSFYQVPEEVLEEPETLQTWVDKSLAAARSKR